MALIRSGTRTAGLISDLAARAVSHSLASSSHSSSHCCSVDALEDSGSELHWRSEAQDVQGTGMLLGRGDKRTWRGKIFKGSFGKARPKKLKPAYLQKAWWHQPGLDPEHPIPIPFPPKPPGGAQKEVSQLGEGSLALA